MEINKKEVIKNLINWRKDLENNPDEIQLKLQIFLDNFKIQDNNLQDFHFTHTVHKELSYIIDHLKEKGKWRISSAISHFDGLLNYIPKLI